MLHIQFSRRKKQAQIFAQNRSGLWSPMQCGLMVTCGLSILLSRASLVEHMWLACCIIRVLQQRARLLSFCSQKLD